MSLTERVCVRVFRRGVVRLLLLLLRGKIHVDLISVLSVVDDLRETDDEPFVMEFARVHEISDSDRVSDRDEATLSDLDRLLREIRLLE